MVEDKDEPKKPLPPKPDPDKTVPIKKDIGEKREEEKH